jgi:hypothetical protein
MVFWANKLALKQHQSSAIINGIGVIRFILRSDFFFWHNGTLYTIDTIFAQMVAN